MEMSRRGALIGATAAALVLAPASLAARPLSVGYDSPAALRGLHVTTLVAPLHVAEVAGANATSLRNRAGIRWVSRTLPRRHLGVTTASAPRVASTAEWQFKATHSDLVPASVQRAAASITIAVVDTGADLTVPVIAA